MISTFNPEKRRKYFFLTKDEVILLGERRLEGICIQETKWEPVARDIALEINIKHGDSNYQMQDLLNIDTISRESYIRLKTDGHVVTELPNYKRTIERLRG